MFLKPRCRKLRAPELFVGRSGRQLKSCRLCLDAARDGHRKHRERIGPAGVRAANLRDKYRISVQDYVRPRGAR